MSLATLCLIALPATTTVAAQQEPPRHPLLDLLRGERVEPGWQIGPIAQGRNYSVNMPRYARPYGNGGFTFDFPYATRRNGHVHYLTKPVRSLEGARGITVRYSIDAAPGTRFVPQAAQDKAATVSLYFQRAGDNWSGTGRYNSYRWFAPHASVKTLAPGQFEMNVSLDDGGWVGVQGGVTSSQIPGAFDAAKANAARVGMVFGSQFLRGHGVYATAPARITVSEFRIY